MPPRRERPWPSILGGYAVFFTLLAAATSFLYDAAAPSYRPLVIRLAIVIAVGTLFVHMWKHFRGDPRWDPASPFEDALVRQPVIPKLDPAFVKLRQELANARESRSYFDKIFWPRLLGLAQAHSHAHAPTPPERSWFGRGPSFRAMGSLLDRVTALDAEKK